MVNSILDKKIKLHNGVLMNQFGLGTYLMNSETETYQAVMCALNAGYRHIDTAQYYNNEVAIGKAVKDFLQVNKNVSRKDIFITSKIWNTSHSYELAKKAFNEILERLQIDYLDLCLVHWPTKNRYEVWQVLEELYAAKKVRAIGVSNFKVHHLEDFLSKVKIKPMVNQIESHPGFSQLEVIEYCQKNEIAVTSWRTLMGGKANEVPLLNRLAKKYNTTSVHIALRWAWQLDLIIIPKSVNYERIINNTKIANFHLSEKEMLEISNLNISRLGPDPDDKNVWKDMID